MGKGEDLRQRYRNATVDQLPLIASSLDVRIQRPIRVVLASIALSLWIACCPTEELEHTGQS